MKRIAIVLAILCASGVCAQGMKLLKDINPQRGAFIGDYGFYRFGKSAVFLARDDDTSPHLDLWKTDGTPEGTYKLLDCTAGGPANFVELNGMLYFTVHISNSAVELWRSDGTDEGTQRIAIPWRADEKGRLDHPFLVAMSGKLFFVAGAAKDELWTSDGTKSGTKQICKLAAKQPRFLMPQAAVGGQFLYLLDRTNDELWQSDGTAGGTKVIFDRNTGPDKDETPGRLYDTGAGIYFTTNKSNGKDGLWRIVEGAAPVLAYRFSAREMDEGRRFVAHEGWVYFAAEGELWKTDGTQTGTAMVCDVNPGKPWARPRKLQSIGSLLYFTAHHDKYGTEAWVSDGTAAGTRLLMDISPGTSSGLDENTSGLFDSDVFYPMGGLIYFSASTAPRHAREGHQLWCTDGTPEGTRAVWKRPVNTPLVLRRDVILPGASMIVLDSKLILIKSHPHSDVDFEPWVYTVNKAPGIQNVHSEASYTIGAVPGALAPSAEIKDDNPHFDGGLMVVELVENRRDDDFLGVLESGRLRINGDSLELDNGGAKTVVAKIGSYSNYMGKRGQPLLLTMTAACTQAVAQEILRALCYSNTSNTPSTKPRKIRIAMDDGGGGEAVPLEIVVKIDAPKPGREQPDSPTEKPPETPTEKPRSGILKASNLEVSCREDTLCTVTLEGTGGSRFMISRQPANGTLGGTAPRLTYTPNADFAGTDEFEYFVSDGNTESARALVAITVVSMNDAPVLSSMGGLAGATAGRPLTITGAELIAIAKMSDVDGDTLSFRIVSVDSGELKINGMAVSPRRTVILNGTSMTWTPDASSMGEIAAFHVSVTDGAADSEAILPVKIQVKPAPATEAAPAAKRGCSTSEDANPIQAALCLAVLALVALRLKRREWPSSLTSRKRFPAEVHAVGRSTANSPGARFWPAGKS